MCDLEKMRFEKERVTNAIQKTMTVSGASIITIENEMNKLMAQAQKNIQALSLLL